MYFLLIYTSQKAKILYENLGFKESLAMTFTIVIEIPIYMSQILP